MSNDEMVEILLSTYNGGQYIEEQLASIQAQSHRHLFLKVRDDGSSDATPELINIFKQSRDWVTCMLGDHVGVVGSFLELVRSVDDKVSFVAFSDQDDVWHEEKVERALTRLREVPVDVPALYFSGYELVNSNLKPIGHQNIRNIRPCLENALVENIVTGCTVVMNREAVALFRQADVDTSRILMHDWWFYLVISVFGHVIYDMHSTMSYRQHGSNAVGARNGARLWINRFSRFFRRDREALIKQVNELLRLYGAIMPQQKRKLCEEFVAGAGSKHLCTRVKYVLNTTVFRQRLIDNFLMKFLIGLGWS